MYLAFKLAWQNSELEHSVFSTRQGVHLSIHSNTNKKIISGAYYKISCNGEGALRESVFILSHR